MGFWGHFSVRGGFFRLLSVWERTTTKEHRKKILAGSLIFFVFFFAVSCNVSEFLFFFVCLCVVKNTHYFLLFFITLTLFLHVVCGRMMALKTTSKKPLALHS